jgi:hypothetical protein
VVSATGISGVYPLTNVEFEIEWAQDLTHFVTVQRVASSSRSYRTWLRDWDTAAITQVIPTPAGGSASASWCVATDDSVIGWNGNPLTGISVPGTSFNTTGTYYERYVGESRVWRVGPTLDRAPRWGVSSGQTKVFYKAPAFRAGKMIVCHDTAQGADQSPGDHSEWHEISLADGSLVGNGGTNDRHHQRLTFASESNLFAVGWNSSIIQTHWPTTQYSCESFRPNYSSLIDGLSGYDTLQAGPYGLIPDAADMDAIFGRQGSSPVSTVGAGFGADAGGVFNLFDPRILTLWPIYVSGATSRVFPDGFFSLQNYYRIQFWPASPVNAFWNTDGMEWRCAFFSTSSITETSSPSFATAWMPPDATIEDWRDNLAALLGDNDGGPNSFIADPIDPITSEDVCPQMIWQRGCVVTLPAEVAPVPWGLNHRDSVRYMRIQVRAATPRGHVRQTDWISRVDWSTGSLVWTRPFGRNVYGGGSLFPNGGILSEDLYIVSGQEVQSACYSVYQWQEIEGIPQWVIVTNLCPDGFLPLPPSSDGETIGQFSQGTCKR